MVKKILFLSLALLILTSSCRKKRTDDYSDDSFEMSAWDDTTVVDSLAVVDYASISIDDLSDDGGDSTLSYKGISFQYPNYWSIDSTKVSNGLYKIVIDSQNDFDRVTINIHDRIIDEATYLKNLKMQITNSKKTKDAEFEDITRSQQGGIDIVSCSFASSYSANESYQGKIRIYYDKKNSKTYSFLSLARPYYEEEISMITNSITFTK